MNREYQHPTEVGKLPIETKFVILQEASISYDDGYGRNGSASTSTQNYFEVITFDNENALKEWITERDTRSYNNKPYRIYSMTPVIVERTVKLDLRKNS